MKNKIVRFSIISVITVLLISLVTVSPVFAAEFISDQNVIIEEDEVIDDDVFLSGKKITINGTVNGDVFAGATEVIVNGYINGSLWTGASSIVINGVVSGSLYAGAYTTTISDTGNIGRNVYYGGFNLNTSPESWIGRSLYSGSYQVKLEGTIANDIIAGCTSFNLDGTVGGDVILDTSFNDKSKAPNMESWYYNAEGFPESARIAVLDPGLNISDDAEIGGEFTYTNSYEDKAMSDIGGTGDQQNNESGNQSIFTFFSRTIVTRIGEFIALVIVCVLLIRFQHDNVQKTIRNLNDKPFHSLLWGIAFILLFPLAMILSLIILGGLVVFIWLVTLGTLGGTALNLASLGFGIAAFSFTFLLKFITKAIFAYMIGELILINIAPKLMEGKYAGVWTILSGVLIYELIRAIPVLGGLIGLVISIIILGAVYLTIQARFQQNQPA